MQDGSTVSKRVGAAEDRAAGPAPTGDGFLELGAHQLAYERRGRGPDLVFVHGWPLHSATFRAIVPQLEGEFTCHLLDLPCAGRSRSADGANVSFPELIAVLRAAIDALGLTRYAFVAHDSGGMLARYVAADDARVAGLVLGNTELPNKIPRAVALLGLLAKLPGGAQVFRATMRNGVFRRSSQGFGPYLENPSHLEGEFYRLFLEPILASTADARRALSVMTDFEGLYRRLSDAHRRLRAPALLIWGESDKLFPLQGARAMLSEFGAGAELVTIPGGKLFFHEEHPDEFVRLARPFLEKVLHRGL